MQLKQTHHGTILRNSDWGGYGYQAELPSTMMRLPMGFSYEVTPLLPVSTIQTKQFRRKSLCIISWMTLSLHLVNKCSLSSSCVPSATITHNLGTKVDHNKAGRQKCELDTEWKVLQQGKENRLFMGPGAGRWGVGRMAFLSCWAGQKSFTKEAQRSGRAWRAKTHLRGHEDSSGELARLHHTHCAVASSALQTFGRGRS